MTDTSDTNGSQAQPGADQDTQAKTQPQKQEPPVIASGEAPAPAAAVAPADWPTDWRDKLAGGDAKVRERLERFGSPADVWKHARSLETRQGEMKAPLPKDPTPEQLAQWRKDNGIAESPDKYDLNLGEGVVIGEQDKPMVDKFLTKMHGVNATNDSVKAALGAYYEILAEQHIERERQDAEFHQKSTQELAAEWGADYTKNVNMIGNLLALAPEAVRTQLLASRTPDGRKFGDDPAMNKFFSQLAREINPAATVVPNAGGDAPKAIAEEIAVIENKMRDSGSEYWTGPKAADGKNTVMQARYLELQNAHLSIKKRA